MPKAFATSGSVCSELATIAKASRLHSAARDIKVLVIGNPANTNCLIAMKNAPDLDPRQFTAMTRLDHNRALSQLAEKTASAVGGIRQMTIWGNHSATQYPDINHTLVNERPAKTLVSDTWVRDTFIPRVQQRGAEIIEARGFSSAASAANAGLEHMRDWATSTVTDDWLSMGIPSDGSYGLAEGLIYSYPVRLQGGQFEIVQGLDIDDFSRECMEAGRVELEEERDAIKGMI